MKIVIIFMVNVDMLAFNWSVKPIDFSRKSEANVLNIIASYTSIQFVTKILVPCFS